MDRQQRPHGRTSAGNFFRQQAVSNGVHARPGRLGDGSAEKPMLPQLLNDARRNTLVRVPLGRIRNNVFLDETSKPHSLFRLLLRKFQLHHRFLSSFGRAWPILPRQRPNALKSPAYLAEIAFLRSTNAFMLLMERKLSRSRSSSSTTISNSFWRKFTNCKASSEFTKPSAKMSPSSPNSWFLKNRERNVLILAFLASKVPPSKLTLRMNLCSHKSRGRSCVRASLHAPFF